MASALLALANPLYQGFKAEKHFIDTAGVDKIGKAGSLKRLSSIPLGFAAFGKGFIGGGGLQAGAKIAGGAQRAQEGGEIQGHSGSLMIRPHFSSRGNAMVSGIQQGSSRVLGNIPHVAYLREHHRSMTAAY